MSKLDELTIGEAKQLASLFGNKPACTASALGSQFIGKYVIVRSRNEEIRSKPSVDLSDSP